MIFQSSSASLNPTRTVGQSIGLPLRCHGDKRPNSTVAELLERVGLSAADAARYPHSLSGGQKQRVNIARALALEPEVIVCDEPTSGLDVSVQALICNLLADIATSGRTSFVFISHDLAVIQRMTTELLVLSEGTIVDRLRSEDLLDSTNQHTRALIDAIPGRATDHRRAEK